MIKAQNKKEIVNSRITLSVTSVGAFLTTMNASTLNIALPTLMKELNTTVAGVGWVIMCYMVTVTVLVIHAGKLSDLYGRKRIYIIGIAILIVSSLFAGLSNSLLLVIIFRILQGIGTALLAANTSAIVVDTFPEEQQGSALGVNSMALLAGVVLGPVVGGLLIAISWRWIFWFNTPIGIFLILFARKFLKSNYEATKKPHFDITGTVSLFSALLSLLIIITFGVDQGWNSSWVLGFLLLLFISIVLFIKVERKAIDPIMDLRVFKNGVYSVASICTFLVSFTRMGITFVLIFYLQAVRGYSPFSAGLMLIPMALLASLLSPLSGRISDRFGSKLITSAGLCVGAIGLFLLGGIKENTNVLYLGIILSIIGAGSGLFQSPNTFDIMSSVPNKQRGVASGTRLMLNNLGMLLSMSICSALLNEVMPSEFINNKLIPNEHIFDFINLVQIIFIIGAIIHISAMILSLFRDVRWTRLKKDHNTKVL